MEQKECPSDRRPRLTLLSVVLVQVLDPPVLSLPSVPYPPPCSAILWLEASWHPPISPPSPLGLTLSLQPPNFAVLAKVVVTHKQMCGQVGG